MSRRVGRVAAEVGHVGDERQRRAAHDADERREPDPGRLLLRVAEHVVEVVAPGRPSPGRARRSRRRHDRERQHDAQEPAHHVEAEHRKRPLDGRDRERRRHERRLGRRPSPRRSPGSRRQPSAPAPRTSTSPRSPGTATSAPGRRAGRTSRASRPGRGARRRHRGGRRRRAPRRRAPARAPSPPIAHTSGRSPWITASAPEDVHDRVQEEREVDREEVAPADGPLLGRDRLDPVSLDLRHDRRYAATLVPREEVDDHAVVLLARVEDRRVVRAADRRAPPHRRSRPRSPAGRRHRAPGPTGSSRPRRRRARAPAT